jgi:hypothetical protein
VPEPLIKIEAEGVAAEPRRVGHRWVDGVVTGAAILLSIISLRVGFENARTQERMLGAMSRPILFFTSGNAPPAKGEPPTISMTIQNVGVGPAFLKHLEVLHEGKPASGGYDLVRKCCMTEAQRARTADMSWLSLTTQRVGGTVLAAEDSTLFLALPQVESNKDVWNRLHRARFKFEFKACYCSVLGECWRSDLSGSEPRPVDSCPTTGGYRGS